MSFAPTYYKFCIDGFKYFDLKDAGFYNTLHNKKIGYTENWRAGARKPAL